jgi:hypothetical protein
VYSLLQRTPSTPAIHKPFKFAGPQNITVFPFLAFRKPQSALISCLGAFEVAFAVASRSEVFQRTLLTSLTPRDSFYLANSHAHADPMAVRMPPSPSLAYLCGPMPTLRRVSSVKTTSVRHESSTNTSTILMTRCPSLNHWEYMFQNTAFKHSKFRTSRTIRPFPPSTYSLLYYPCTRGRPCAFILIAISKR